MNVKTLHTLNIVFLVATLVVNYLANALPIGGMNTGELSALYPTLFTPAGFTFGIWGMIYLGLIAFTTYLAWGLSQGNTVSTKVIEMIGPWFIVSCIANLSWILLWHSQMIGAALMVMLVLWFSLFKIYSIVDQNWLEDSANTTFAICIPFSIYWAWISVALIANTAVFLTTIEWGMFGQSPDLWTMVMLLVVGLVGMFVLWKEGDTPFVTVFIWALWGIYNKPDMVEGSPVGTVAITVLGMLVLGVLYTAIVRFRNKNQFMNQS